MATAFKQAARTDRDGPVKVARNGDDSLSVSVSTDGAIQTMTFTEYNASRVVGMLSLMLGIPISKAAGKAIKL